MKTLLIGKLMTNVRPKRIAVIAEITMIAASFALTLASHTNHQHNSKLTRKSASKRTEGACKLGAKFN